MLLCFAEYGLSAVDLLGPGTPFYDTLCAMALSRPLDAYVLVCQYCLEALAVEISKYLLPMPLHNLTDAHVTSMGPIYLRRLIFLHLGRTERLRVLLRELPGTHLATPLCDSLDQKRLLHQSWHVAASEAYWEVAPDTSGMYSSHICRIVFLSSAL